MKLLRRPPVFLSFAAILAVTGLAGNHLTSRTSFCGACHEMKAIHAGWTASAHAANHCYDCHTDRGVAGAVKAKAQGLRELLVHLGGHVDMEKVKAEVPDQRCVACHDMADRAKLGERTVNSHAAHLEAKLDCIACHAVVGHTRDTFGGFGAASCNPCHNTKPMAQPDHFIQQTPCTRTSDSTATLAAQVKI